MKVGNLHSENLHGVRRFELQQFCTEKINKLKIFKARVREEDSFANPQKTILAFFSFNLRINHYKLKFKINCYELSSMKKYIG